MRGIAIVGMIVSLLLHVPAVEAQPGVGIESTSPPTQLEQRRPSPSPGSNARDARPGVPYSDSTPVFIGPTVRSETTELGPSGWIAPNPPVGGLRSAGSDTSGWASLGFTFTWGGPRNRPSSGSAVR